MDAPLAIALSALAEAPAPRRGQGLFLLWELRGVLAASGPTPDRIELDGGCRVERETPGAGIVVDSAFLVGGGPTALAYLVAGRAPCSDAADEWSTACEWLSGRLVAQLGPTIRGLEALDRALTKAGASTDGLEIAVHGRARAWRRTGEPPRAELEIGVRVRRGWSSRRCTGWVDRSAAGAASLPWVEVPEVFADELQNELLSATRRSPNEAPPELLSDYRGPVVFQPRAAAWLIHEMGHAALERSSRPVRPARTDLLIKDDPRAAPWPAGFQWDDMGQPARAATLWDAAGSHAGPWAGRQRRASIRDRAIPFLTCTQLEATAPASPRELPVDVPVIGTVSAGRFDPPTGTIVLEAEDVRLEKRGGPLLVPGSVIAVIDPDEAWSGIDLYGAQRRLATEPARCTRLGALIAVMVGAQTIALDSVHLAPSDAAS